MTEEAEAKGHPIRSLLKLAVVVGLVYAVGRFLIEKKEEYADLTESEARQKLIDKIGPRIGESSAAEIADQVIPKLRERGLVRPDLVEVKAD
jgi:hypothetical protein